jgi:hypothetical protein
MAKRNEVGVDEVEECFKKDWHHPRKFKKSSVRWEEAWDENLSEGFSILNKHMLGY